MPVPLTGGTVNSCDLFRLFRLLVFFLFSGTGKDNIKWYCMKIVFVNFYHPVVAMVKRRLSAVDKINCKWE